MDLTILILMLALAAGFTIIGFVIKDETYQRGSNYLKISGFLILMLAGVLLATTGLKYQQGYTITTATDGTQTLAAQYSSATGPEGIIVGLAMILGGMYGAIMAVIDIYDRAMVSKYGEDSVRAA